MTRAFITTGLLSAILMGGDPATYRDKVNEFFVSHVSSISTDKPKFQFTYQLEKDSGYAWKDGRVVDLGKFRGEMAFYQYADSLSCSAAVDKLLAKFPTEGTSLQKNVNHEGFKIIPSVFVISDCEISVLSAACESDTSKYSVIKVDFLRSFADSTTQVIDCSCGGPLIWR